MVPRFVLSSSSQISWAIRHRPLHVRGWLLRTGCACYRGNRSEYPYDELGTRHRCCACVVVEYGVGATLTWNANSEPDLAGYRVYQCGGLPCTRNSGASLLVTLGKVTSLNIGTPAEIQYYFVTAYDSANHESGASNVVVFIPVGSPPPPTPGGLRINSLS